ncbi:MAG: sigma-70 family RNA polymerase sigma factor [Saprospiraceae bacterium]
MKIKGQIYSLEHLIIGCIQNDRKCQQGLYELFFDTLLKVCYKYTKDESEALTILNDGYLKIFKNIHLYKNIGSFEGWSKKIMYHSVIDHYRKRDKTLSFSQPFDMLPENPTSDNVLDELMRGEILQLLDLLPENSAKALKLFAFENYTHADIGKELNITEGTSRWHVAQARNMLKEKLNVYYQEQKKFKVK